MTTFKGAIFSYDGSINDGLIVHTIKSGKPTGTQLSIDTETIKLIKNKIIENCEIKMGACRDKPSSGSLGEMLQSYGKSPQLLSYVLPLLEEAGLITHKIVKNTIWVKLK